MAKRKYICPNCGNKTGANILYGMPAWDVVQKDVEAGFLVLGGCCQDLSGGPERECTSCGHQWRIKRKKPTYLDEVAPIPELFVFQMGSFGSTSYRVEWKDGLLEYSRGLSHYSDSVVQKELAVEDWKCFWGALLAGGVCVWDWKGSYDNPIVLDGTEWQLELHTGKFKKRIYGCNAYPGWGEPDWNKSAEFSCLVSAIGALVGDRKFGED